MANRRLFTGYDQSSLQQPSSMMTPRGSAPSLREDAQPEMFAEHPETTRRRLTPMVGEVEPNASTLQALLAMFGGQ